MQDQVPWYHNISQLMRNCSLPLRQHDMLRTLKLLAKVEIAVQYVVNASSQYHSISQPYNKPYNSN